MRACLVGRFQPYHDGHHHVVRSARDDGADELVVVVGSADASHEPTNPFTGGERVAMVSAALRSLDMPTHVVPVQDVRRNAIWAQHVRSLCPAFDTVYTNNDLVARLFDEAGVAVREPTMVDRDTLAGTAVRERMVAGDDWAARVPDPVAAVVRRVDGVERLQALRGGDARRGSDASDGS